MVVMIVDDQISVISGLIFGINWKKIGIKKVLKAYNALEAKLILKQNKVDILLSDIEMPMENGLSLFSWTKDENIAVECIFLTAHADFIYAKEALQLGSFDYILQPARYEEVEKVLVQVMDKIRINRKKEELAYCGDIIDKRKNLILDAAINDFINTQGETQQSAIMDLQKFGVNIIRDCKTYILSFEIIFESQDVKDWNINLLKYTLNNICSELLSTYGYGVLMMARNRHEYLIYLYKLEPCHIEKEIIYTQLNRFMEIYREYNGCKISCYIKKCDSVETIQNEIESIDSYKENNVMTETSLVDCDQVRESSEEIEELKLFFDNLNVNIQFGLYEKICDEGIALLDNIVESKKMNGEILKKIYREFLRVMYIGTERLGISISDLFEENCEVEQFLKAYESIADMKWLIRSVTSFLNEKNASEEKQKTQIDYILQYIRSNLDLDIKRTDIAEAVHLNPNYISRLFKNKMGISLKEYIMDKKLDLAKELIRNTNLPIGVITSKIGYSNFSYFAQVYKKKYGLSPNEDRKQ